ncbi:MAG: tetratricopeptide repeat protein [Candidatus Xenobia bacterium]
MRSYRRLVVGIQWSIRAGLVLLVGALALDLRMLLTLLLAVALLAVMLYWLLHKLQALDGKARPGGKRPIGTVVLPGNVWAGCHIDRISADWPDSVRGFCRIWSGRHRLVSTPPGGPASLDFVLYPGEVFIRKLEGETWTHEHPENEFELRERARHVGPSGPEEAGLADYSEMVTMLGRQVHEADVPGLLSHFARLAARVGTGERFEPVLEDAQTQGASLIGVPLTGDELAQMTGRMRHLASRQPTNDTRLRVLQLALAVLPEDPWLLLSRARLLCEVGLPEEASQAVNQALLRDQVLQREGLREGQILKAEILGHLGRAHEGLVLITHVLAEHPQDAAAQRVQQFLANRG